MTASPETVAALSLLPVGQGMRSSSPEAQKDDTYWFSDGDITLVAEKVQFRVFAGTLAYHSPVFKDMFTLAQADSSGVVRLSDRASDVRHILDAITPTYSKKSTLHIIPHIEKLSALVYLGDKYQMSGIIDYHMDILEHYFTTDADSWLQSPCVPVPLEPVHAISVVNFARISERIAILPTALLSCSQLSIEAIINGYIREDGIVEKLSPEDQTRVIVGREKLIAITTSILMRTFGSFTSLECWSKKACQGDAEAVLKALPKMLDHLASVLVQPFFKWEDLEHLFNVAGQGDDPRCGACEAMRKAYLKHAQREVFAELPEIFGITVDTWSVDVGPPPEVDGPPLW